MVSLGRKKSREKALVVAKKVGPNYGDFGVILRIACDYSVMLPPISKAFFFCFRLMLLKTETSPREPRVNSLHLISQFQEGN